MCDCACIRSNSRLYFEGQLTHTLTQNTTITKITTNIASAFIYSLLFAVRCVVFAACTKPSKNGCSCSLSSCISFVIVAPHHCFDCCSLFSFVTNCAILDKCYAK